MSSRRPALLASTCSFLLRLAALLLPARERREWLAEWRAELHYVLSCPVSHRACLAFSMGAIPDAVWIRRHARGPQVETAAGCLVLLAALAALSVSAALLLPAVRQEILPPAYRGPNDVVVISHVHSVLGSEVQVSASQFMVWSTLPHPGFSRTAFYEPSTVTIELDGRGATWLLGRATENLTTLLHLPVSQSLLDECRRGGAVPLVLSRSTWMHDFGGEPNVVGRSLTFAGHSAIVVAVAPAFTSDLPLQVDAWSLETDDAIAQIAAHRFSYGYMLAQVQPGSRSGGYVDLLSSDGSRARLFLVPLSSFAEYRRQLPEIDFLLSLFMTCLMMPALLAISLRTGLLTERLSLAMRTRGWIFLAAKLALLLPLLYCGPLLIAFTVAGASGPEHGIQVLVTIGGALASVSWVIDDQRQRCPHCLRKLTSPARVGERSRSFLSFSGMEFVCAEGHGLLHVPDYPTSWFAAQRWLSLDPSWRVLFQAGH